MSEIAKALVLTTGVSGLFVAIMAGLTVVGVLALMWRVWWMHPLWALVMEPLGVPAISYWHLFALLILWGWVKQQNRPGDHVKDEYVKPRAYWWAAAWEITLTPVLAYYLVCWAMGVL